MKYISKHISYADAIYSDTAKRKGIANIPGPVELVRMKILATRIYEPVVAYFGVKVYVSSFFRNVVLNKLIGGSKSSQHCLGEAMDIDADYYGKITNKQLFHYIKDNFEFDQLIWEYGTDSNPDWVHVSYTTRKTNRKQALRTRRVNGKTTTEIWNLD